MRANSLEIQELDVDGSPASGGVNPNLLINGNFDIWQRGTNFVYTQTYAADRWGHHQYQQSYVARASFVASGEHPGNSLYVIQSQGDAANSFRMEIGQGVEYANTVPVRGKTVTLSGYVRFLNSMTSASDFKIRAGSTSLSANGAFNTTNYLNDGFSSFIIDKDALPATWTKFEVSYDVPLTATNLCVDFYFDGLEVYGSSEGYQLSQIKLEEGSVATPFVARPIGEELALCQRYYTQIRITDDYSNTIQAAYNYRAYSLPVTMRINPTVSVVSQFTYFSMGTGTNFTPTSFDSSQYSVSVKGYSLTNGNGFSGGIFGADAEL